MLTSVWLCDLHINIELVKIRWLQELFCCQVKENASGNMGNFSVRFFCLVWFCLFVLSLKIFK